MDHTIASTSRTRPALRVAALIACAAGLLLLTQCRMVADNLTGVDLSANASSGRSKCVHRCNKQLLDARRAENQRHQKAVVACHGDASCLADERELHTQIERQIAEQNKACRRSCYNEGSGRAGR